jgi:hypothetical protein
MAPTHGVLTRPIELGAARLDGPNDFVDIHHRRE